METRVSIWEEVAEGPMVQRLPPRWSMRLPGRSMPLDRQSCISHPPSMSLRLHLHRLQRQSRATANLRQHRLAVTRHRPVDIPRQTQARWPERWRPRPILPPARGLRLPSQKHPSRPRLPRPHPRHPRRPQHRRLPCPLPAPQASRPGQRLSNQSVPTKLPRLIKGPRTQTSSG